MLATVLVEMSAATYSSSYGSGNGTMLPSGRTVHGNWGDYGYWGCVHAIE